MAPGSICAKSLAGCEQGRDGSPSEHGPTLGEDAGAAEAEGPLGRGRSALRRGARVSPSHCLGRLHSASALLFESTSSSTVWENIIRLALDTASVRRETGQLRRFPLDQPNKAPGTAAGAQRKHSGGELAKEAAPASIGRPPAADSSWLQVLGINRLFVRLWQPESSSSVLCWEAAIHPELLHVPGPGPSCPDGQRSHESRRRRRGASLLIRDMKEQSPSNQTSLAMMQEPQEVVEETVTIEEDPGTPTSHVSVVTSDDGTTRRTETKVTKMVKTVTTRTVRQVPLGPDGLPLPDGTPPLASYTDSIDRRYMKNGDRFMTPQATSTLTRSYNNYSDSYGDTPEAPYRHYGIHDGFGDLSDNYGSLSRGINYRPRYPYMPTGGYRPENSYTLPIRKDDYGHVAQPQVPMGGGGGSVDLNRSQPERFQPEPYGLEDDRRSLGPDEEEPYDLEPDYSTANRRGRPVREPIRETPRIRGGYEDPIEAELIDERHPYIHGMYPAPLAQPELGSLASLDRMGGRRSPSIDSIRKDPRWRDPDLPEVIAMLGHPIDPVKSNAAAYLQHLCYENDKIKKEVRQLKGVPVLVGLLDHPKAEVHRKACGALRNISYGKDHENKVAIKNCDGIPALIRLLRKTNDMEVRELITGTLWNLSSYEPLKMVIINHGLQTLTNEVIIPHSGWEQEPNEDSKPRDAEWTTVFKNTSGCLRNVSSDGAEARRRLRECDGLVDALLHALQSAVGKKDMDNKSVENCVCIMRNLSYHVHKEVPGAEKYQDPSVSQAPGSAGPQRKKKDDAGCFGGKKAKGRKNGENDKNYDTLDLPKRTEPTKGTYESDCDSPQCTNERHRLTHGSLP
ncbi:hypothetical protein Z043_101811 [Scleropages formosus]|uniref:Armadillo repeat protein deleted in velo-cardio-facial syndrome-like n=1 Tax=Scleropages formosus TaxID=113540 RepID=A0A0P7XTR8_SCLFO|nr:hypothetical protein Z043_101811 [Scleropages formosus]